MAQKGGQGYLGDTRSLACLLAYLPRCLVGHFLCRRCPKAACIEMFAYKGHVYGIFVYPITLLHEATKTFARTLTVANSLA